jgi:transposase
VQQLQARVADLEAEIARLRQPPPTSRNSSNPPSRDQKANQPKNRKRNKHGPPFGHQRQTRPLVNNPDHVIRAVVEQCEHCQSDLCEVEAFQVIRRQVTELPEVKPVVIETQQMQVRCPYCQQLNRGELPAGLEGERYFGPRLEASVVYLKHEQHLSYERIVLTIQEMFGVRLSEGAVASILARAGQRATPAAAEIKKEVITSAIIKSDETSARVAGRNHWQWVFVGKEAIYHYIAPSRSAEVIQEVMGELMAEVWVCDCFGAQLKAPAKVFQLCLQHQLRDLQRVLDQTPQESWALAVQNLFREAIHLKHRFECPQPELTLNGYLRRVTELENKLDALLEEKLSSEAALRLQARFLRHRDKLLVFLHYANVPATNNESEQALRTSVIHRKVTNGFRSEWGARAYAALQSVIATAKLKGQKVFETLVNLMGPPVLHFLDASSP